MQTRFVINEKKLPADLKQGLTAIQRLYPQRFCGGKDAFQLAFAPERSTHTTRLETTTYGHTIEIHYSNKTAAFRALGRLLGADPRRPATLKFQETAAFQTMGIMLDVSRNGVFLPSTLETLLCRMALMGLNMLMLYTEDTYEVPGEPFFGYLRGRYTQAELKKLDTYAAALGIEMIPCIQTLGHLEQILQWPAYAKYRDTDKVMLAEDSGTYVLLEKMIAAATAPYSSRRIHIGMDEAHGIGSGVYRQRFGEKRPFDILNQHLKRVCTICRKAGLQPMIWSDMYFRLGSKNDEYYDPKTVIPPQVARAIPKDVDLVYWDYYHHDQAFYEDWIARHRAMGKEPIMAGGIYTWNRFWTALPHTFSVGEACLNACKKTGLREVFMTMWGDDGTEYDLMSALPGLQFFAEHVYAQRPNQALLHANFTGICGADFSAFTKAAELDIPPYIPAKAHGLAARNICKALLWQDPALAIIDPQTTRPAALAQHYQTLAKHLAAQLALSKTFPLHTHLKFPMLIAQILSIKTGLRQKLGAACKRRDRKALRRLAQVELTELQRLVKTLHHYHRDYWFAHCKPFGWETLERRYGGLSARLETLRQRLNDYAAGRIADIPELTAQLETIWPKLAENICVLYPRLSTPSCIK